MAEPLRRSVRVHCSVEHAFEVFTERVDLWWPPGHRRFAESQLVLEARVGGRFVERATSGEEVKLGEVVECQAPHAIRYTWYPGAKSEPTLVDVRFERDEGDTVVHVLHSEGDSGLGDLWPERVALFERGWSHVLAALKAQVDGTPGRRSGG